MLMFKSQKFWYLTSGTCLLVGAIVAVLLVWRPLAKSASLLPTSVTKQITGFTPYFYTTQIPAGYHLDASKVVYNGQILFVPLSKSNEPGVVLSEQSFPTNVSDQDLQQNGQPVQFTSGTASINDVEGRLVGTLIPNDRKTLILVTTQDDQIKDDLTALLQQLQPLSR